MQAQILEAKGWKESAYITWQMNEAYDNYHVYYAAEGEEYTQIDQALLRRYQDFARADVPGLKAGNYRLKIVPVNDGQELSE
ncbi:MAG: pectate lyase, partial [Bacteroidales bacterium]|nr:pectate lyase [Bacteroidales bacterium]